MSGASRSRLGAPVFHASNRCGSGPPVGYSPGFLPGRLSAAFVSIGSGYAILPARVTAST